MHRRHVRGGFCENTVVEDGTECGESTECTVAACASGACESTLVPDGTACGNDAGTCQQGSCQVACTEQGIRNAIAAGGGPYTFGCDGPTTVVTEAEIVIDNDVALDGEGSLTIDGNDNHLVFLIRGRQVGSQTYEDVTLELRRITITKGADVCGAIWNFGTLTLANSTVSGNSDRAICNEGTLTLTSSTVSGNGCTTYAVGAGISNLAPGTATLTDSTVLGNTCAQAAGIYNAGTMTLTNSIVSGNGAEESGGGIYNAGTMTVINSTVSDNSAGWTGGGIVTSRGTLTLTNSTVSGNSAVWAGGGISNAGPTGGMGGTLTLTNSTVSGNNAGSQGGGIRNWGTATLTNSTVVRNTAEAGSAIYSHYTTSPLTLTRTIVEGECVDDAPTSLGYNIESPGDTCGFDTNKGDQVNVSAEDLKLGPLQGNGGPTETHALLPGSVAIDKIPQADCVDAEGEPLTEDQRGLPRPETGGTMCDVGSVEVQ